jgi:hypothetical protein
LLVVVVVGVWLLFLEGEGGMSECDPTFAHSYTPPPPLPSDATEHARNKQDGKRHTNKTRKRQESNGQTKKRTAARSRCRGG